MKFNFRHSASVAAAVEAPVAVREQRLRPRVAWMALLLMATCFEGLGRKYLTFIPQNAFFFIKDAILVYGLFRYGIQPLVRAKALELYRGFLPVLVLGIVWTIGEVFNPNQASIVLGFIGLRAYWLWWLAPLVVASALEDVRDYRGVVVAFSLVSLVVAAFAIVQFARPSDDPLNLQIQQYDQFDAPDVATVSSTGKVRVSSTFPYITGFADFTILVPPLLLTIGLQQTGRVRVLSLIAASLCAVAVPTSGSRGPILQGIVSLFLVAWGAGLLKTRAGRRIMLGAIGLALVAGLAMPTAIQGVTDRFTTDEEETRGRFSEVLESLFPPVTIANRDFTLLGLGAGMMQNSRMAFGVAPGPLDAEEEPGRYLAELGPIGYLLVWLARLGLIVALLRAARILRRSGQGAFAGLALAYAALVVIGRLTVDHVWASLHFVGMGLILRAAMHASTESVPAFANAQEQIKSFRGRFRRSASEVRPPSRPSPRIARP